MSLAWLGHILGLDDASGGWYLWWSGIGSDLSEAAIVLGVWQWVRHHNCHVHRCLRVGRHPIEGTGHVVCRRHHPDGAPSAADLTKGVPDGARRR